MLVALVRGTSIPTGLYAIDGATAILGVPSHAHARSRTSIFQYPFPGPLLSEMEIGVWRCWSVSGPFFEHCFESDSSFDIQLAGEG